MRKAIYQIYLRLADTLRSSRIVFRIVYGYSAPIARYGAYWDWTTLILRSKLLQYATPGDSVLDMGTGAYGVLANYLKHKFPSCTIVGVDHLKQLADYAHSVSQQNGVTIIQSDLFEKVEGLYNLILFNAPYITEENGIRFTKATGDFEKKRWGGGLKGDDTIQRFLEGCPPYLNDKGIVLLGVNHFHIKRSVMQQVIQKSCLHLVAEYNNTLTLASIYVLKRK